MQYSKSIFVLLLFLSSVSVFAQPNAGTGKQKNDPLLVKKRIARLKADIVQEIKALSAKEQAVLFAQLGVIFWKTDSREGNIWLGKGVETVINPATELKDQPEKLNFCWKLLSDLFGKDAVLTDKLIAAVKEIKIDEASPVTRRSVNMVYISIARGILNHKKDDQLALEFALRSLKGGEPAVRIEAALFFAELKFRNESLANSYFAQVIENVRNRKDPNLAYNLIDFLNHFGNERTARSYLSDSQKKEILETMVPFIQAEALALKQRNDCSLTRNWGNRFSEEYKQLFPEKATVIEEAIVACRNANLEAWKKPDFFLNRRLKTSQDYVDLAKEIDDKSIQTNFLRSAAVIARNEQNPRLSLNILERIDRDYRDSTWTTMKNQAISKLIEMLLRNNDFAEIENVLKDAAAEHRNLIVVDALVSFKAPEPGQKDFVYNLMNRTRAEFNKIENIPTHPSGFAKNLSKFQQLAALYVKFGFFEEALAAQEDLIAFLNRVTGNLTPEFKEQNKFPIISPRSLLRDSLRVEEFDFTSRFFDRIYENIGKIENPRRRLSERLELLKRLLGKVSTPSPEK